MSTKTIVYCSFGEHNTYVMAQREVEVVCGSSVFPVAILLTLLSVSCCHKESTVNIVVTANYTVHTITCCTLHLPLLLACQVFVVPASSVLRNIGANVNTHTPDT